MWWLTLTKNLTPLDALWIYEAILQPQTWNVVLNRSQFKGSSAQAHKKISGLTPHLCMSSFALSHLYFSITPPPPQLSVFSFLVFVRLCCGLLAQQLYAEAASVAERRDSCRSHTTTACFPCIPSKISKKPGNWNVPMGADAQRNLLQFYFQMYQSILLGWLTLSVTVTSTFCMSRKAVFSLRSFTFLKNTHVNIGREDGGRNHLVLTPALLSSCARIYLPGSVCGVWVGD